MNSKERMLAALRGEKTDLMPVTPHWWGLYKFELAGILHDYENESQAWAQSGQALADTDMLFYETFKPDMFHLTTGASRIKEPEAVTKEKERLREAVSELESITVIDEYVDACYPDKDEILTSGVYDHIRILSEKYGDTVLLALNEGNPISWVLDPHGCIGFENGLISLIEKADKMTYLLERCYDATLQRVDALKEAGGHAYIGSETYCSCDIISPQTFRDVIFEPMRYFYQQTAKRGIVPITYFLGNINPLLEDITALGAMGLLVEEGKKDFTLDVSDIYRRLEKRMCLFGNLDSVYTLQMGTPASVAEETRRQTLACADGGFVMANGCPLSFTTPAENIRAMIQAARGDTTNTCIYQ